MQVQNNNQQSFGMDASFSKKALAMVESAIPKGKLTNELGDIFDLESTSGEKISSLVGVDKKHPSRLKIRAGVGENDPVFDEKIKNVKPENIFRALRKVFNHFNRMTQSN